jgi:hypothetical protein
MQYAMRVFAEPQHGHSTSLLVPPLTISIAVTIYSILISYSIGTLRPTPVLSRSAVYIRTLLYRAPGATHATLGHTHTVDGNRQAPRPHDSRHTHRRRGVAQALRRPHSAAARGARAAAFVDPPITRMLCAPIVPYYAHSLM